MLNSFGASIKKTLFFIQNISPFPDNIWSPSWKATCAMKSFYYWDQNPFYFFLSFFFLSEVYLTKSLICRRKQNQGGILGIETKNTFIHSRSSFENETTRFRTKMAKVYNRFHTESAQKPYPFGFTPFMTYIYLATWLLTQRPWGREE